MIEWLEMQVTCESDLPPFDLNEVLNQWEDWNSLSRTWSVPAYTVGEAEKLSLVASTWEGFCSATPTTISSETEALGRLEWATLISAGREALPELHRRGRLSEDVAYEIIKTIANCDRLTLG